MKKRKLPYNPISLVKFKARNSKGRFRAYQETVNIIKRLRNDLRHVRDLYWKEKEHRGYKEEAYFKNLAKAQMDGAPLYWELRKENIELKKLLLDPASFNEEDAMSFMDPKDVQRLKEKFG